MSNDNNWLLKSIEKEKEEKTESSNFGFFVSFIAAILVYLLASGTIKFFA